MGSEFAASTFGLDFAFFSRKAISKSMFESFSSPLVELPGSCAPFQRCGMSDDAELSKAGDASVVVVLEDMLLEGKESSVELRRILSSTMARCAMWSRAVQSRAELSALLTFLGLKQSSWEAKDIVKGVAQSDSTEMHR